jgi:predicted ATPase
MFQILKISVTGKHTWDSFSFESNDCNEKYGHYYTHLFIGINGSGKSILLRRILDIFNYLASEKAMSTQKSWDIFPFFCKYKINGNIYTIDKSKDFIKIFRNKSIIDICDLELPTRFVSISSNINDRFPIFTNRSKYQNNRYKYAGIRTTSNNAFISNSAQKIIKYLPSIFMQDKSLSSFSSLLSFLDFSNKIRISFNIKKVFLNLLLTYEDEKVVKIIRDEAARTYQSQKYAKSELREVLKDKNASFSAVNYLRHFLADSPRDIKKNKFDYFIELSDSESVLNYTNSSGYLETLMLFGVISLEGFYLTKNGSNEYFKVQEASSGELNILFSMCSLLSFIDSSSLILIDEPETSLHPNWQIKYFDILIKILSQYRGCNLVIASHSHFMVTGLSDTDSSIYSIKNKENRISIEKFKSNPHGWSPENILYNVFGMTSTRNSYLEHDLRELVSIISNNEKKHDKVDEILKRLNKFNILPSDPISQVIDRASNYIKSTED